MPETAHVLLLLSLVLLVALVTERLAGWLRLPFNLLLVIVGFVGSEALIALGVDIGLRWEDFHDLVFFILLPILVFDATVRLNYRDLLRDLLPILVMAVPMILVSTALMGTMIYYAINHPAGFPWLAALITGAMLSATDPDAAIAVLKQSHAPRRLIVMLEGESLFNNATAIVTFSLLVGLAVEMASFDTLADVGWLQITLRFGLVFFGSLGAGVVAGVLACALMLWFHRPVNIGLISVVIAYLVYVLAEEVLQLSGVMTLLSCGLLIGEFLRRREVVAEETFFCHLWDLLGYVAGAMIFIVGGATITTTMFSQRWLAMLAGIVAALLARTLLVHGTLSVLGRMPGVEPLPWRQQFILNWGGGVRGAVTMALALSLPLQLDYWFTIQSIGYGVVIFSLLAQAGTMRLFVARIL